MYVPSRPRPCAGAKAYILHLLSINKRDKKPRHHLVSTDAGHMRAVSLRRCACGCGAGGGASRGGPCLSCIYVPALWPRDVLDQKYSQRHEQIENKMLFRKG